MYPYEYVSPACCFCQVLSSSQTPPSAFSAFPISCHDITQRGVSPRTHESPPNSVGACIRYVYSLNRSRAINLEVDQFHSTARNHALGSAIPKSWLPRRGYRIGEQARKVGRRACGRVDGARALRALVVPLDRDGIELAEHSRVYPGPGGSESTVCVNSDPSMSICDRDALTPEIAYRCA